MNDLAISRLQETHRSLRVLPRFCIENYLIEPQELIRTLNAIPTLTLSQADTQMIVETLSTQLPQYLKHGALWHTLFPLRQQLLTEHTFVGFFDRPTFPDDAAIEAQFKLWSDLVDDHTMMQAYHQKLVEFQSLESAEQYRLCLHGKRFWEHVVYPVLKEVFKKLNSGHYIRETELKNRLFQHIVYPQDMLDFVDKLRQGIEA